MEEGLAILWAILTAFNWDSIQGGIPFAPLLRIASSVGFVQHVYVGS